jgi:hypothetical protein
MLEEALVLGRDDGIDQRRRHVLDVHQHPPLLPEFPDELPLDGVDPQGDLRLVVGQGVQGRQVGIGQGYDQPGHDQASRYQPPQEGQRKR